MDSSEALGVFGLIAVLAAGMALFVGPSIWAFFDASRIPEAAWRSIGRNKGSWMAVFVVGIWMWVVGLPAAIVYLKNVRPELEKAMADEALPGRRATSRVLVAAGVLLASLWVLGAWAYLTHDH